MVNVFLLWDMTTQEKGEPPALEDVFETEEAAQKFIDAAEDEGYGADGWSIEKREVKS
jgi:hypothetical protein